MKKMSFTNSMWTSLLGRATVLALFVFCFAGLQTANAQVKAAFDSSKNTCTVEKLAACNGAVTDSKSTQFTDDGSNDGNYADPTGGARIDTVTFAPADAWHRVQVVFNKFDVAALDMLEVYQGDKAAVRGGLAAAATATGTGVSQAFGGWVDADCDPKVNPSGALTFIFRTNGDNIKGAGWDAWVDCADRKIELETPNIASAKLTCDDDVFAAITLPGLEVKACGAVLTTASDTVTLKVTNQHGDVCLDTLLSKAAAQTVTRNFAFGSYKADYTLLSDKAKTKSATFSVQAPSLVCNDDIRVPLGSACMIVLTPDDILEQPCDTISGVLD